MFQGTEANIRLQGTREALSVVVVSIILNPICDFVEPGVLCLSEPWLHLFCRNIRLLYRRESCFLVDVLQEFRTSRQATFGFPHRSHQTSFYVSVYFCRVEGMQHGTPYLLWKLSSLWLLFTLSKTMPFWLSDKKPLVSRFRMGAPPGQDMHVEFWSIQQSALHSLSLLLTIT